MSKVMCHYCREDQPVEDYPREDTNKERPYHSDNTASRLLSEVKHCRARLVLRWGTTLESLSNECSLVLLEKEFDAFWLDELVTMTVLLLNEDVFITQAA
eukprot:scaffold753_cov199-Alexandrium_tamarense.AAC.3